MSLKVQSISGNPIPNRYHTHKMVDSALINLNERMGSSVISIAKYICRTYDVDAAKNLKIIKKYIKTCVESGKFIQKTGVGLTGSFSFSPLILAKESRKKEKNERPKVKPKEKKNKKTKVAKPPKALKKAEKSEIKTKKNIIRKSSAYKKKAAVAAEKSPKKSEKVKSVRRGVGRPKKVQAPKPKSKKDAEDDSEDNQSEIIKLQINDSENESSPELDESATSVEKSTPRKPAKKKLGPKRKTVASLATPSNRRSSARR